MNSRISHRRDKRKNYIINKTIHFPVHINKTIKEKRVYKESLVQKIQQRNLAKKMSTTRVQVKYTPFECHARSNIFLRYTYGFVWIYSEHQQQRAFELAYI